jgi:hypothetical protein
MAVTFLSDKKGRVKAVQLPIREWDQLNLQLKKYKQAVTLKKQLTAAFTEVKKCRKAPQKSKPSPLFYMSYNVITGQTPHWRKCSAAGSSLVSTQS